MESAPQGNNNAGSDYFLPIESEGDGWSIVNEDHITEIPNPDPNVLIEIANKMEGDDIEDISELPKELLRYSILLTRPDITDDEKLDIELAEAYDHIKNIVSKLDAQGIFNFVSNEGKADIPTFYALHEVINSYQFSLIDSNDIEELNQFDEIRKTSYWMAFYLMTRQSHSKDSTDTQPQTV